jgi:hypothetical protein
MREHQMRHEELTQDRLIDGARALVFLFPSITFCVVVVGQFDGC